MVLCDVSGSDLTGLKYGIRSVIRKDKDQLQLTHVRYDEYTGVSFSSYQINDLTSPELTYSLQAEWFLT